MADKEVKTPPNNIDSKVKSAEHERELYFKQAHQRHNIKQLWKAYVKVAKTKDIPVTAEQNAAYCLLRGRNIDKAFTPLSRESKIKGLAGGNPYIARDRAVASVKFGWVAVFKPWQELLKEVTIKYDNYYEGGWAAIVDCLELPTECLTLPAKIKPVVAGTIVATGPGPDQPPEKQIVGVK